MIKMHRIAILISFVLLFLCSCSNSNITYDNALVFNNKQLNYYTENNRYIFTINGDEPCYFDKLSGETGFLIKDCFYDKKTSGYYVSSIFSNEEYVYYLKNYGMNNYEISEICLDDFDEKNIYRDFKNKLQENSFLNITSPPTNENYNMLLNFFVVNECLYIIMSDGVYFKPINKSNRIRKIIDGSMTYVSYVDGNIYYINDEMDLIKYSVKTKRSSILTKNKCMWVIACRKKLYYSNLYNKGYVYSIDFSGKNEQLFLKQSVSEVAIDEDYLYYSNLEDNRNLYHIKHDGTENEILCNKVCYVIDALDDRIYFLSDADNPKENQVLEYKCIDKSGNYINVN